MCVSYAASRRVRWNAPIGYYVGVNDSICVSTQIARNSRKLVRIRGRYPEGTKRKRIPGPGLFVLYVRSAPCCVYLGPPISPQSGIFSQMRRLEQTPLRLSIKADSLMWTTMKRFGPAPAPVLAFVVTLPIFLSLTFVPSIYRLLFHYTWQLHAATMRQAKEYSGIAYGARDFILSARPIEVRESMYVVYIFDNIKFWKAYFWGKK